MKALVFIENKQQLAIFNKHRDDYSAYDDLIICALTPFAVAACEKEKQEFVVPENYYSTDEYKNIGEESIAKTKELISLLDEYSRKESERQIGFGIEIGTYYSPLLYMVLGAFHSGAFQLHRVITSVQPDLIICFLLKRPLCLLRFNFLLHPLDTLYGKLLSVSKFKEHCIFIKYNVLKENKDDKYSWKHRLKLFVNCTPLLARLINSLDENFKSIYMSYKNSCIKKVLDKGNAGKAALLGGGYSWDCVIRSAKFREKFTPFFISIDNMLFVKRGYTDDIFSEWFDWNDSFYDFKIAALISDHIRIVKLALKKYIKIYRKKRELLKDTKIILTSYLMYPAQHFIAHIANNMDIPVIVWSHGEKGCSGDICIAGEVEDVVHANYFLSFGPHVSQIYNDKYLDRYSNFKGAIAVGSPNMDNITQLSRNKGSNNYILYATGKYLLNTFSFGSNPPISNYKLYSLQKKIIGYLGGLKADRVICKLHPISFYGENPIEANHVEKIYNEKSFSELISEASLIILDAPSTTCLEAASSNKPLFIVQGYMVYSKEALDLLSKRAVVVNSPQQLIKELELYFKTNHYKADVNNREFVRAFATYLDDGCSAERAVDSILKISGVQN